MLRILTYMHSWFRSSMVPCIKVFKPYSWPKQLFRRNCIVIDYYFILIKPKCQAIIEHALPQKSFTHAFPLYLNWEVCWRKWGSANFRYLYGLKHMDRSWEFIIRYYNIIDWAYLCTNFISMDLPPHVSSGPTLNKIWHNHKPQEATGALETCKHRKASGDPRSARILFFKH